MNKTIVNSIAIEDCQLALSEKLDRLSYHILIATIDLDSKDRGLLAAG